MSQFNSILFDLDGTISNPKLGITKSVALALDYFNLPYASYDELCTFIGPPLEQSFMNIYGLSKEEAQTAIQKYREYYVESGIFECSIYDGIPELLMALKEKGTKVYLATSKPTPYATAILEHFNIKQYFDFIGGSNLDNTRVIKAEVIAHVLEETKTIASKNVLMIGDRKHDIIGAKATGIAVAGILYGYGSREELEGEGADYILDTVSDVRKFIV